jgi:hypothetical protein
VSSSADPRAPAYAGFGPKLRRLLDLAKAFAAWLLRSTPQTPQWILALDSARARLVCRTVLVLTLSWFVLYYGAFCFTRTWGWDFEIYCAAVSRLYENLLHPSHEAVTAPGTESFVYSPYLVFWGALGKLTGVTPYRALQFAGIANMSLFAAGATFLVSRHSLHRRWELSAVCFIFATLFLRWQHFGWSSDTSLINLQVVQTYPSTVAWGLALFAFGLMKSVAEAWRWRALLALSAVLGVLLVTHTLTASWAIGIVGLYGLFGSLAARKPMPLTRTVVSIVLAFGLALLWPYSPLLGQLSFTSAAEGTPFGETPFFDFFNLYLVALPCVAYLALRLRKHGFWSAGFVATIGALKLWQAIGINYGDRYSLFASMFAQFLLAEVMALGAFALLRGRRELLASQRFPRLDRWFTIAMLLAALVAWLPAPWLEERGAELTWPTAEPGALSPHDEYYARFSELRPYLSSDDVVLLPSTLLAFDIASITGARVVSSPHAGRVPDHAARREDVRAFFQPGQRKKTLLRIAVRYGATKVLVPSEEFAVLPSFRKIFGRPLYEDAAFALFAVELTGG